MNYMYCEVYNNNIYINSACLGARVTVETPEKTIVNWCIALLYVC